MRSSPVFSQAQSVVSGALRGDIPTLKALGLGAIKSPDKSAIRAGIMSLPTYAANKAAFDLAMDDLHV